MPHSLLPLVVHLHTASLAAAGRLGRTLDAARRRATEPSSTQRSDAGQTTAEYALVLLGAAAVALLLLGWAAKTNRIGKLFDWVLDEVVGRAS